MKYIIAFSESRKEILNGYITIENGIECNKLWSTSHDEGRNITTDEWKSYYHEPTLFIEFNHKEGLTKVEVDEYLKTNFTELFL